MEGLRLKSYFLVLFRFILFCTDVSVSARSYVYHICAVAHQISLIKMLGTKPGSSI